MGSVLFEEVSRAMLSLVKPFQAEACDLSITSWVELDITLKDMTLVHSIYEHRAFFVCVGKMRGRRRTLLIKNRAIQGKSPNFRSESGTFPVSLICTQIGTKDRSACHCFMVK
ncbi:hypothetical protein AMECASPLE_036022 [Ameca splendens]|uniref:Uncharacterized protein n=1 Tax=Ameca splendens TaxID=208324 RepID=A0ABV1A608_9TELE